MRFQSKDIQYFISYNVWPFLFSLDVNTIYGIHIQLTMPNTIENESKNRVQKNKMAIKEKT